MLTEDQDILALFDEFYFIPETAPIQPVKEKEIIKETSKEFKFIGGNKKRVLFVFNDKNQLSGEDLVMVENLVTKAIGWSMDDIALINLSQNEQINFQEMKNFFNPLHVLFWGCDEFLAVNSIPQKNYEVLNGKTTKVLTVQPISTYLTQPDLKKLLWASIQSLFELK
jgi:hypothetical protein